MLFNVVTQNGKFIICTKLYIKFRYFERKLQTNDERKILKILGNLSEVGVIELWYVVYSLNNKIGVIQ